MRDGMTIAESFVNMAEAELALAQLASMGITGLLRSDNCGGMRPHMDLTGGVHLYVPDAVVDEARTLLRGGGETTVTTAWTCPGCGEEIEAGFDACWNCGVIKG